MSNTTPIDLTNTNKIEELSSSKTMETVVQVVQGAQPIYEVDTTTTEIIPSVKAGAPKPIKIEQPIESNQDSDGTDADWLNTNEALKILDKDPITNPNVDIITPAYFVPVPNEQVDTPVQFNESTFVADLPPQFSQNPIPLVLDAPIAHDVTDIRDELVDIVGLLSTSIQQAAAEEILPGTDTYPLPEDEDLKSNVQEDINPIPPTYQPGMENMNNGVTGPIVMESDEVIDSELLSDMNLVEPPIVHAPTEIATPVVVAEVVISTSAETTNDIVTEDTLVDDPEAPLIPSYEFFRDSTKETIIPLHKEELAEQLIEAFPQDGVDSRKLQDTKLKALQDPTTFSGHLNRASNFLSSEQSRLTENLKKMTGPIGMTKAIDGKKYGDAFSGRSNARPLKGSSTVGGDKALQTAMSLISGIRRVALYNSGFNVVIRPPLLNELHQYYLRCRSAAQEFGRQFGQFSFIPADVELKAAGFALFESLVQDSNLKDWKTPGMLRKHISILDFDVCLWGMATLMFPEGTDTEMFCNKRDCKHVDIAKIDIAKMRFNDYSKLSDEAIKFVCATDSNSIRTPEDLANYHTNILQDTAALTVNDEWSIHVEVPSIEKVLLDGEAYVANMASKVQMRNGIDVADFINTKYFRVFAPWINRISYCDNKSGAYLHFTDPIRLPEIIEALQLDKEKCPLDTKIIEFMNNKKVTQFGYLYSKCPNCDAVPDVAVNGIIPCDMQYNFFTLTMDRIS